MTSTARQAFRRAVLEGGPRLVEAMFLCQVSTASEALSGTQTRPTRSVCLPVRPCACMAMRIDLSVCLSVCLCMSTPSPSVCVQMHVLEICCMHANQGHLFAALEASSFALLLHFQLCGVQDVLSAILFFTSCHVCKLSSEKRI